MRLALIVLGLALTIYALLDCARTPEESMPAHMPKALWIMLFVIAPGIGPIAWIIVSRVKAAEERGGYVEPTVWSSAEGTDLRPPRRARRRRTAPDEDPEFLASLDEEIRRERDEGGEGPSDRPQDPADGEAPGPDQPHR